MIKELSSIDKAKDLAMLVHADQKRRSGEPYFTHPFRVFQRAKMMNLSKDEQIVALLHDIYEDTKNKRKIESEIKRLFNDKVFYFVLLLSHDSDTNYNSYILNLAKRSDTALRVKMVDMLENLKDNPTDKQKNKYVSAIDFLLSNNIKIDQRILDQFNNYR